jgi:hypothetical protein
MPIDLNRPLLQLPSGVSRRRTVKGNRPHFPTGYPVSRQESRIGPKLQRLRTALDAPAGEAVALRNDPTALAPECLLVFELREPLITFASAVAAIQGLEFIGEDDEQIQDDDGNDIPGHYYAVFSDQRALRQMLSLWDRWVRRQQLPKEFKPWERLFACLHDLRRWGAKDRVSSAHAEVLKRLIADLAADETVHIEIELVFRQGSAADTARVGIRRRLEALGAHEVAAARYDDFAYDALLVEISRDAAIALSDRENEGIAGLGDAYRIRPQSVGYGDPTHDNEMAGARETTVPSGEPIVAILDAVPLANHPLLTNRLIIDDPDDLTAMAAGPRLHGTAMSSLVAYVDLNGNDPAIARPIYFRPIMVDTDNFSGRSNERTLPNRLLIDDIVRAVRRIKHGDDGQPAEAPHVAVVNISFGVADLLFDGTISPLARCLDWLSWEYGILFVVSAGNCTEPLVVAAFVDEGAFLSAAPGPRTDGGLTALRDARPKQVLLAPAEAINVLTVGALHYDLVGAAAAVGSSYDPLPDGLFPSLTSRLGLGFNRSIKPDLLAPGGRLRVQLQPTERPVTYNRAVFPSRLGGLRVAGPIDPVAGPQVAWSGATSGAAALTTHALHLINDALEAAYGERYSQLTDPYRALLLKAILLHRVKWPVAEVERIERIFGAGEDRHPTKRRADLARLYGFGTLDQDSAISCALSRATGWGVGALTNDAGQTFQMPLPEGLIGQRVPRVLTATACWFTPIVPGRQSYRAVKLRIDEKESNFAESLKSLGTKISKDQHDSRQTQRGTIVHRRWEGTSAAKFQNGNLVEVKVSRMWDDQEEQIPQVPFAIAVSIEADGDIPIYDQVLSHINVALRPRVPQPVPIR